jgi:hypothetical protein
MDIEDGNQCVIVFKNASSRIRLEDREAGMSVKEFTAINFKGRTMREDPLF